MAPHKQLLRHDGREANNSAEEHRRQLDDHQPNDQLVSYYLMCESVNL